MSEITMEILKFIQIYDIKDNFSIELEQSISIQRNMQS